MTEVHEIQVPDIQPEGYPVEVMDETNAPIAGAVFSISVDRAEAVAKETGSDGGLKIVRPKKEVSFSLTG